jgi:hypothetical protein
MWIIHLNKKLEMKGVQRYPHFFREILSLGLRLIFEELFFQHGLALGAIRQVKGA